MYTDIPPPDPENFATGSGRPVDPNIVIVNTRPQYCDALGALQVLCYPTLDPAEHIKPAHYRRHIEVFPDGQLTAVYGDMPVGSTTTLRYNFDFDNVQHSFWELIGEGWLTTHEPHGEWLYGADMMVHPEFRQRGISRQLYAARHALVKRLNLRGQIAAGMIIGYHHYAEKMDVATYMDKVAAGELIDPTLSSQLKIGFRYVTPIYDYLADPRSGNASALIVWDNPDYAPVHSASI